MKPMKFAAVALAAALAWGSALACTTVVVGSQASADGSLLIARSADSSALKAQHLLIHTATTNAKGMYRSADHNGANKFEYPVAENGLRYTTVPNWKTQIHGATGFNEAGVGFSGTESIFARDDALKLDPYNEETGITEDDIPEVILPRAKTAREGVEILGKIVETIGAGEGFGVVLIDNNESWYFETGTGHQWLAQRTPKDKYFASGNQGRLQQYDPKSPDFMASKTLVQWATKNGFYDPKKDGEFNFSKAYTRDDYRDRDYNDPRVWVMQKHFNPSIEQPVDDGRNFAVYLKPEAKITVDDLKFCLRNHYEGTDHDPYSNGLNGNEPWRPISVFRTYEAHILQVRPNMPKEIGCVIYIAFGMADLSCFMPFYQGLKSVPLHFGMGTDHADSVSLYWKFRKLQTLAMTDYPKLAPIVKKAFADHETQIAARMQVFEAAYTELAATDKKAADDLLQNFSLRIFAETEELVERLMNDLFTVRTNDIEKANFFRNRKNKD